MSFDPANPRQSFPELERNILQYWKEEDVFKRSLRGLLALDTKDKREASENTFSFYDGPPFATGLPHYGHLLAGTIKDVIPRYQTMKGKTVQRRFGWDCHGLPVEYEVEKEFNLDRDKIKRMGVKAFNDLCRSVVLRYTKEWRATVERSGRFVDMDWDYRTMDPEYMESIWWVFKQLYDKGLIYEGHKPMHICPRCVTPLSNFEVTQGYKDVTDVTAVAMFLMEEIEDGTKTYFLAWTTTPWTLPGNLFLAVNPAVNYQKFKKDDHLYIASEHYVSTLIAATEKNPPSESSSPEILAIGQPFPGTELVGQHYRPLFPYFADRYPDGFKVVAGDFVTTEDGTGIVHIAPGFGEDDFEVGKREGAKMLQHVTMEGKFTKDVTDFVGLEVKPKDAPTSTDQKIVNYLQKEGTLFEQKSYTHSYPHCWRCDTPLLNYATSCWFVSIDRIKDDMLRVNGESEWLPSHLRDGRFGKWLENARDWAISRNRYWGTPLPLWRHEDTGEIRVLGSRDDLMATNPKRFTKVTVLRHAESIGNTIPIYQGELPGTDLSERGREQAALAADMLRLHPADAIYTSPHARAVQTGEILGNALDLQPIVDNRLREVHFGEEYEGKTVDFNDLSFVRARRAHKLETEQVESIYHFPGMETWGDVEERVRPFLEETIARHPGEHIVIVTHADPVQHVRHFFTKEDPKKICHQPYPSFAGPETFYFDHQTKSAMDLHKETVDGMAWLQDGDAQTIQLTLVRHGESVWNAEDRVGGSKDTPLSDKGKAQAVALQQKLNKEEYDVIVSSDLARAVETARLATDGWNMPIETLPVLREQNLGDWEEKLVSEVAAQYPDTENFLRDIEDVPGGESRTEFLERVQRGLRLLRQQYTGKRVLLFSHRRYISAVRHLELGAPIWEPLENTYTETLTIAPKFRRIPDVLDCWFESGSMPYSQSHYPFNAPSPPERRGVAPQRRGEASPPGFPADFIAEGIDQTRGWFYTLTVLAAALFGKPAFYHCIVNGTVLAEDGKKMSKRLKNYPEPMVVMEKYGADAVRFALMNSQAVRAEDMRFSEKVVEETLRNVLLPLWNTYSFFVTYANAAEWTPQSGRTISSHSLDLWIRAEVQDLVNRMSQQLDRYDLSAATTELFETINALTNWYVRLSRRRFAGKSSLQSSDSNDGTSKDDQAAALHTLYEVLLTLSQLMAPFCPFIAEAIYLNLTEEEHSSVHLTRWPETRTLHADEEALIRKTRVMRSVTSLGLAVRSEKKIKIRQPLRSATVALPLSVAQSVNLSAEDLQVLRDELNVKSIEFVDDPGSLAEAYVQVDARKTGPRLGARVQEIIREGKAGHFEDHGDGTVTIMNETFTPEEAKIVYRAREGNAGDIAADRGIVVSIDTAITRELELEGNARDLIRAVQQQRKDAGFQMQDRITLQLNGVDDILEAHKELIERETNASLGTATGDDHAIELEDRKVTIRFSVR